MAWSKKVPHAANWRTWRRHNVWYKRWPISHCKQWNTDFIWKHSIHTQQVWISSQKNSLQVYRSTTRHQTQLPVLPLLEQLFMFSLTLPSSALWLLAAPSDSSSSSLHHRHTPQSLSTDKILQFDQWKLAAVDTNAEAESARLIAVET